MKVLLTHFQTSKIDISKHLTYEDCIFRVLDEAKLKSEINTKKQAFSKLEQYLLINSCKTLTGSTASIVKPIYRICMEWSLTYIDQQ